MEGTKDVTIQSSLASALSRRSRIVLDDEDDDDDDDDEGLSSIARGKNITSGFFTVCYR